MFVDPVRNLISVSDVIAKVARMKNTTTLFL